MSTGGHAYMQLYVIPFRNKVFINDHIIVHVIWLQVDNYIYIYIYSCDITGGHAHMILCMRYADIMNLICHSFKINTNTHSPQSFIQEKQNTFPSLVSFRGPFWHTTSNIITIKMPIVYKSILNKVEHYQHIIEVQCHTYHTFLYLQYKRKHDVVQLQYKRSQM